MKSVNFGKEGKDETADDKRIKRRLKKMMRKAEILKVMIRAEEKLLELRKRPEESMYWHKRAIVFGWATKQLLRM